MQASSRELIEIEKENNNNVFLSDQLKDLFDNKEDMDHSIFESKYNSIYLIHNDMFYKTKFLSFSRKNKIVSIELMCDSTVLSLLHTCKFNKASIEYSADFIYDINISKDYNYCIKLLGDNSYLIEIEYSEV